MPSPFAEKLFNAVEGEPDPEENKEGEVIIPEVKPEDTPVVEGPLTVEQQIEAQQNRQEGDKMSNYLSKIDEDGNEIAPPKIVLGEPEVKPPVVPEVKPDEEKPKPTFVKPKEGDVKPLPTFEKEAPAPAVQPPVTPPAPAKDENDVSDLDLQDSELYQLKIAEFASKNNPKHKGLDAQFKVWFRKHRKFIDNKTVDDPDYDFDQSNEEYVRYINTNQPKLSAEDLQEIQVDIKVDERMKPINDRLDKDRAEAKADRDAQAREPKVKEQQQTFANELYDKATPTDLKEMLEDPEKSKTISDSHLAMDHKLAQNILSNAADYGNELIDATNGVRAWTPSTNPKQMEIYKYIQQKGLDLHEYGGSMTVRNGKQFLPIESYNKAVTAGQADQFWTFEPQDVLGIIQEEARRQIVESRKNHNDSMVKAGWTKGEATPKTPLVPPVTPPAQAPTRPPRSTPKPPAQEVTGSSTAGSAWMRQQGYE